MIPCCCGILIVFMGFSLCLVWLDNGTTCNHQPAIGGTMHKIRVFKILFAMALLLSVGVVMKS